MPIFLIPIGFIRTKMKHWASFTNPYVVPNLYFNLEVGTQKENFKELYWLFFSITAIKGLCETLKVVVVEIEVNPVTLYTNQSSTHKSCFFRHYMQE